MRLTGEGRLWAAVGIAAWTLALATANLVAAALGACVALAFAFALATLAPAKIEARRVVSRTRVVEGDAFGGELELRARGRPVWVELDDAVSFHVSDDSPPHARLVRVRAGEPVKLPQSWSAKVWGEATIGPLRLVRKDAFGLLEVSHSTGEPTRVDVLPATPKMSKIASRGGNPEPALGAHNVSRPGDGSEFFALREYQPGDSIRRINWKASARTSKTMVNQVTRDSFARITVVLDAREKESVGGAQSALVRSGRAAAAILYHHERLKDNLNVLVVNGEAKLLSAEANPRLADLMSAFPRVRHGGEKPMTEALRENLRIVRPRTPIYFVTSGALDATLREAIMIAQSLKARPYLVAPEPALADEPESYQRAARLSRERTLAQARGLGIPVATWASGTPVEVALAAL